MSKITKIAPQTVIVSRTDSIGDVLLTLPLCVALKRDFPNVKIVFLASSYTIPVVRYCSAIDEIMDATELLNQPTVLRLGKLRQINADAIIHVFPNKVIASLAKKAKIPHRIGTSHRPFHLLTCNHRVNFTRKNSNFHEAQLNFHLLKPFGYRDLPTLEDLRLDNGYLDKQKVILTNFLKKDDKPRIILHAKSQGSAVEWPLEKYNELAIILAKNGYSVYFTGTEKEGVSIRNVISFGQFIYDITGKLTLEELVAFIDSCTLLIACSTGPLHIAGCLNRNCIGLFTPKRPMHPGRWKPLGMNSETITAKPECVCESKDKCTCLREIEVEAVFHEIQKKLKQ